MPTNKEERITFEQLIDSVDDINLGSTSLLALKINKKLINIK